ncbi:hypothetical protein PTKIN_Ptkin11bG0107700 [Pterospermum kingtungense]
MLKAHFGASKGEINPGKEKRVIEDDEVIVSPPTYVLSEGGELWSTSAVAQFIGRIGSVGTKSVQGKAGSIDRFSIVLEEADNAYTSKDKQEPSAVATLISSIKAQVVKVQDEGCSNDVNDLNKDVNLEGKESDESSGSEFERVHSKGRPKLSIAHLV